MLPSETACLDLMKKRRGNYKLMETKPKHFKFLVSRIYYKSWELLSYCNTLKMSHLLIAEEKQIRTANQIKRCSTSAMGFPQMEGGHVLSRAYLTASRVRRMAGGGDMFTQHISKDVPAFLFSFDTFFFILKTYYYLKLSKHNPLWSEMSLTASFKL